MDERAIFATAHGLISSMDYMTVATVTSEGEPWNSPVRFYLDRSLAPFRLLWVSSQENQHSFNIRNRGKAFIVIYDSRAAVGTGQGVYLQCDVRELNDARDVAEALRPISLRDGENETYFTGTSSHRIYEALPTTIWINDGEKITDVIYSDFRVRVEAS